MKTTRMSSLCLRPLQKPLPCQDGKGCRFRRLAAAVLISFSHSCFPVVHFAAAVHQQIGGLIVSHFLERVALKAAWSESLAHTWP